MQLTPLTRYLSYQIYHAGIVLDAIARSGEAEEIHEFRVSLRRTKSLARLYLNDLLPFPEELKSALKATNSLRELDVLIASLKPSEYPKTLKLLRQMRQERFDALWEKGFYERVPTMLRQYYDTLCAANPAIDSAQLVTTVEGGFKTALARYRTVDENTPQKELHQLRVDFKISRYGLEFLRAERLGEESEKIEACKRVQNTLGNVQDAYNQVEWLRKLYRLRPNAETKRLLKERKKGLKKLKAASRSALSRAAVDTHLSG